MRQSDDLLERIWADDKDVNKKKAFALLQNKYKFDGEWSIVEICHDKWAYVTNRKD